MVSNAFFFFEIWLVWKNADHNCFLAPNSKTFCFCFTFWWLAHIMNNFDGILIKYPEICIDNFIKSIIINKTIRIFILTHFHDDHMHGLEDADFHKHLADYRDTTKFLCSKITRQFIATCDKYKHLDQFCTELMCDYPLNLELNSNECVTITFYGRYFYMWPLEMNCLVSAIAVASDWAQVHFRWYNANREWIWRLRNINWALSWTSCIR